MKSILVAFALLSALGSYAAEVPEPGIAITDLYVGVAKDTLKLIDLSLYAAVYDRKDLEDDSLYNAVSNERLAFFCLTEGRSLPQFPDTLDCQPNPGIQTSGTFRFSIHAPAPQISAPADSSELIEGDYVPDWTNPIILYMEWDLGNSRTFGSYKVPAETLNTVYSTSESVVLNADIGQNYIPVDVTNQPN